MLRSILVIALAPMALGCGPDLGPSERTSAARYALVRPGIAVTIVGETYQNGQLTARSTSRTVVKSAIEFEGRNVHPYEMTAEFRTADGKILDSAMTMYQYVDNNISCTVALVYPGGKTIRLDCEDIDLKTPIAAGTSWTYSTRRYPYGGTVQQLLEFEFVSTIDTVGISRVISEQSFTDCARITTRGLAEPGDTLNCPDGDSKVSRIESASTRVVCPGVGDVHSVKIERYYASGDGNAVCHEQRAEYETRELTAQ